MSKQLKIDQQMLTTTDFKRGQINALEIVAEYFFDLRQRGQQFLKTDQVAQVIQTIKLNLEESQENGGKST